MNSAMASGLWVAIVLALLAAAPPLRAAATPEEVVAELGAADARGKLGVAEVERDSANPRVLVVRVDPDWYRKSEDARREAAVAWREKWQASVPQGTVAVLDAKTEQPVVRFAPGGKVFLSPGGGALMNMQPR
ncbi:MAG: hypothetical protein KIT14_05620 [bacterium]|nr:hypothetical protein [bacterium]